MPSIVIQDACVLINLLASGRFEDIASGCGFRFAIASVWSTCGLLRHWQNKCSISDSDLGGVLGKISSRAKYRPKFGHPEFEWWANLSSD